MLASVLVYASLVLVAVGVVSLAWPLGFLRARTRAKAAMITAAGLLVTIVALAWPVSLSRVGARVSPRRAHARVAVQRAAHDTHCRAT